MHEEEGEARERRVQSHSARVAILAMFARDEDELTAPQIRAELSNLTLRSVYYHLQVLEACDLIAESGGSYKLA
jgi:hypothetical protein